MAERLVQITILLATMRWWFPPLRAILGEIWRIANTQIIDEPFEPPPRTPRGARVAPEAGATLARSGAAATNRRLVNTNWDIGRAPVRRAASGFERPQASKRSELARRSTAPWRGGFGRRGI